MLRSASACSPTILLVEDDPVIAGLIADILEDADYRIDGPYRTLSDGAAALASHFPAAAILDIRLADSDAGLLADDLENYGIPFVFCSGLPSDPVANAHPDAPLIPKIAMARKLVPALKRIIH